MGVLADCNQPCVNAADPVQSPGSIKKEVSACTTFQVYTNWDSKRKSGGWSATCTGCPKPVSGKLYVTTSDKLALTGLIEGIKEFAQPGDTIRLVTKNGRVKNAVRHPANSIHCAMAREFRATIKAQGVHYTFE